MRREDLHRSGPAPMAPPRARGLPLFRAGVGARLGAALVLSGLLWAAILWAGAGGPAT